MASTTSDGHGLPSFTASPPSAFLYDGPLFPPSPSSAFLDNQAAATSFFHLAADYSFPAAAAQDPSPPTTARKPTRKRPRPSRRPPTTVLNTDASNFRAMVQEFTGFPAPPPFAAPPHLHPGGLLAGTTPTRFHFKLPELATSQTYPPSGTTTSTSTSSLVLNALAMFAKNNGAISGASSGAAASDSDLYRSYGQAVAPFEDGIYEAEAMAEDQMVGGHGRFSSPCTPGIGLTGASTEGRS